jgi:glycosyltransferase involved in cell wall biosynthesis
MDALIVSVDEPQLERGLEAVKNQTVPFSNIIHINNVVPESVAFNQGLDAVKDEWFMKIDGDMILYKNAVEIVQESVVSKEPKIYCHNFRVYDTFLDGPMRGISVLNTEISRTLKYPNMLGDDVWFGQKLIRRGYIKINYGPVIATHFENPDEFQLFRRFYAYGVKHGTRFAWHSLQGLYKETGDPVYDLSRRMVEFGMKKGHYPSSHNIEFDLKMFKEFKDGDISQTESITD